MNVNALSSFLLVALALREQIIAGDVPVDAHDWKMDLVVCPDGIIGDL